MQSTAWRRAWEDSDLPARHRRVLSAVALSMGGSGGEDFKCYPGAILLGKRAGYSERRVRQTLAELDGGWLTVVPRPGRTPYYLAREPGDGWALDSTWAARGERGRGGPPWDPDNPGAPAPESRGATPAPVMQEPRRTGADEIQRDPEGPSGPGGPPGASSLGSLPGGTPRREARPGCLRCGRETEPYFDVCRRCLASEEEETARRDATRVRRGRDDWELRKAKRR
jgi:hypothetical protein